MSLNDRCAEALYAIRSGVSLEGIPGLREYLAERLADGVAGVAFPPRDLVSAIRAKGQEQGFDLYAHVCARDVTDEYGDIRCSFCI